MSSHKILLNPSFPLLQSALVCQVELPVPGFGFAGRPHLLPFLDISCVSVSSEGFIIFNVDIFGETNSYAVVAFL